MNLLSVRLVLEVVREYKDVQALIPNPELKRKTECPQIATIQAPGQHGRWTHSSPPSTYESPSPNKAKDAIISMEGGLGWPQPRFRPQSFVFFQLVLWLAKQVCWMGTAS